MRKRNLIMLEGAQKRLSKIKMKEETKAVWVTEASGRVCVKHIYTVMDRPPLPRSPSDGHAVRGRDTVGASEANLVRLNIIGHIYASTYPKLKIGLGEAARIMIGAPVPEEADSVIMQERTDEGSESAEIYQSVTTYGNYCKKGEDTCRGALLMEKGRPMCSSHIGILSSRGIESIPAYSVPVAGVMTMGDELVPVEAPLGPGKTYNSNGPFLTTRIEELGMKPLLLGREGNDTAQLAREIRKRLTECDALVTSGGVPLGVRDCMPYVAEVLGAGVLFRGINIRPRSPMLTMLVEDKPVFYPSGNPFAVVATFEVLVGSVLERIRGRARWRPEILLGILGSLFPKSFPTRCLVRGKIEDGKVWLSEGRHSSGMLSSMTGCNCLTDTPAGSGGLRAEEQVKAMLIQTERRAPQTAAEFSEARLRQEIYCRLFF